MMFCEQYISKNLDATHEEVFWGVRKQENGQPIKTLLWTLLIWQMLGKKKYFAGHNNSERYVMP